MHGNYGTMSARQDPTVVLYYPLQTAVFIAVNEIDDQAHV